MTCRETEAKELKNKRDYSESYWFRLNKVVRQVEKQPLKLHQRTEPNTQTHSDAHISQLCIDIPNALWETRTPFSDIFLDYSGHGFSSAPPDEIDAKPDGNLVRDTGCACNPIMLRVTDTFQPELNMVVWQAAVIDFFFRRCYNSITGLQSSFYCRGCSWGRC